MKRHLVHATYVLGLAVALLGACGGDDSDHNAQDVNFARKMVPHHQQAITMSDLALSRSTDPQVQGLATRIKAAQGAEISLMQGWLKSWGAQTGGGGDHGGHGMGGGMGDGGERMPGMVSGPGMAALGSASGAEFDRLFLQAMTDHHKGALDMANVQLRDGKFAPAMQLARQIITSQEKEIAEMEQLLSSVPAAAP